MKKKILVAGGTGDLGERIIKELIAQGAEVHALVRAGSDHKKVNAIKELGGTVITADMSDLEALTKACLGISCVVSALAGLRDVIVNIQSLLLDAAVAAGVPRFIPSDYSSDFTRLPEGENRNFDLRREFHLRLEKKAISATSVFIGAFADILFYNTPVYDLKKNTVGYWGDNPDWKIDFTTKDNTAQYTASVALDDTAPRILRIASFQLSPKDLVRLGSESKKMTLPLIHMGGLDDLAAYNKRERAAQPEGENDLYPKWQQSQYMHGMFSVRNEDLDIDRYPDIRWTSAEEVLL